MHLVIITQAATRDLEAIADHVSGSSIDMAEYVIDSIVEGAESLIEFPERGAIAPESAEVGAVVRYLLVFQYRVLYVVRPPRVLVIRVVHGSRRTPVQLR